jgi:nitrous oxidase accessory protein NosD
MSAKLRYHAAPATLVLLAVVLALTVHGLLTLSGAEAANTQPNCGDTITTDTTLHEDLVNCPTNGIVIGADNVTLDLNGHTIDGDGTIHAHLEDVGVSILNHDGITVKDGSIRQFAQGFSADGVRDIRLLGVAASQNDRGGITVGAAARILIRDCSVNGTGRGAGLLVTEARGPGVEHDGPVRHARVVDSSFRHNGYGIRSFGTKDSVIKRNLLSDNRDTGIAWGSSGDRLMRNRIVRNETGIIVNGDHNVIARNRVSHSRRDGVRIGSGRGNLLARNVVAGAATGIRIAGQLAPPDHIEPAVNTVIRGNRLRQADDDGLLVEPTAKHTLLRHNSARHSQDDGFDVDDRTAKLSRNRADRNGDLGIEAVRGVNDGGGNVARHNGDRRQCVNVKCH